jgi:phytoene synthase
VTRKTSFYYSFLVLPGAKRAAILAVFDFCRAVDDGVDLAPDQESAAAAVRHWRAELARVFDAGPPVTPQGRQLQPVVEPFHLPRAQFEALIDGVAMDIAPRRYQTFADLEAYCHRVASAVGLICAEIFGYRQPAVLAYARDLGVALQLTNILRDVAVDFRAGRCYLPQEDLARFGCAETDIAREVERGGPGVASDSVRATLEHQAARARVFFDRARRALPPAEAQAFLPAEIMRAIYAELLRRIETRGCDVFSALVRVPRARQAQLAMATWWALRFGRAHTARAS